MGQSCGGCCSINLITGGGGGYDPETDPDRYIRAPTLEDDDSSSGDVDGYVE